MNDRVQELQRMIYRDAELIEVLEDRIEDFEHEVRKLKQELAEAYKEGYREGFLAAREQQAAKLR